MQPAQDHSMESTTVDNALGQRVESLYRQAVSLYGQERANSLRHNLEQIASHMRILAAITPPREVEPGFFL